MYSKHTKNIKAKKSENKNKDSRIFYTCQYRRHKYLDILKAH